MDLKIIEQFFSASFVFPSGLATVIFLIMRSYYVSSKETVEQLKTMVENNRVEVDRLRAEILQLRTELTQSQHKRSILHKIICHHKSCEHYKATDNCPVQKEYDKNENDN